LHQKRVTIYDIAKKVGVSHTTVALALRNHHRISEKRREQILSSGRENGLCARPAAGRAGIVSLTGASGAIAEYGGLDQPLGAAGEIARGTSRI